MLEHSGARRAEDTRKMLVEAGLETEAARDADHGYVSPLIQSQAFESSLGEPLHLVGNTKCKQREIK